jgi:multidrug resistance efflux pump
MREQFVLDLDDCTEFHQTLLARPPRVVHGTALLLSALLVAGLVWAALTQADLVVRAQGRVRPVTAPRGIVYAGSGEALTASIGCRLIEVNAREGDLVRQGDILLRFDTGRLDNEIARRRRIIRAAEEDLARLARLEELAARRAEAARAKAEAELAQAQQEVRRGRERRDTEIRLARLGLSRAADEQDQLRRLFERHATARSELAQATVRLREAEQTLAKAQLPVDEDRPEVLRRSLALIERGEAVRREESVSKRAAKQAELDATRLELANLELERAQAVFRAPFGGVVTAGDLKVGDFLERGKTVLEIAEQDGFRFEAAVPSEEVGHVRVGLPARIKLDAYDYQRYGTLDGAVCFVSPDSGVREGRPSALYMVRVAFSRDEVGRGAHRGRVKLGMSGSVEIRTGRESLLSLLVKRVRQTISLG